MEGERGRRGTEEREAEGEGREGGGRKRKRKEGGYLKETRAIKNTGVAEAITKITATATNVVSMAIPTSYLVRRREEEGGGKKRREEEGRGGRRREEEEEGTRG
jgi:hypothetical protein